MDIQETYLFPYARKGLANNIAEEDVFGNVSGNEALAKMIEYPEYKKGDIVFDAEEDEVEDAPKEEE